LKKHTTHSFKFNMTSGGTGGEGEYFTFKA